MLYEIFENGKSESFSLPWQRSHSTDPYPEQENSEIKSYLLEKKDVRNFFVLDDAPDGMQEILNECLEVTPQNKPTFKQLHDNIHSIELKLRHGGLKNERKQIKSYVSSNNNSDAGYADGNYKDADGNYKDTDNDGYYKDPEEDSGVVDQGYE
jgi:hypothetical protein